MFKVKNKVAEESQWHKSKEKKDTTQQIFISSKSAIETLEKCAK